MAITVTIIFGCAFYLEQIPEWEISFTQIRREPFVFQGVHMLFDGRPDQPWGNNPRRNSLIFIGRNLDRVQLNEGFRACLA
jgi:G3E family GTPase